MLKVRQGLRYRDTVGILLVLDGQLLIVSNTPDKPYWDVPQGGVEQGETDIDAFFRESRQELGKSWLSYIGKPIPVGERPRTYLKPFVRGGEKFNAKLYRYYVAELRGLPSMAAEWITSPCRGPAPTNQFNRIALACYDHALSLMKTRAEYEPAAACKVDILQEMVGRLYAARIIQ